MRDIKDIENDMKNIQSKLKELETEYRLAELTENANNELNKFLKRWVKSNEYETGYDYIYVEEIESCDPDYVVFIGYGIHYDEQSGQIDFTDCGDENKFVIYHPDNLEIIGTERELFKDIKNQLIDTISMRLEISS